MMVGQEPHCLGDIKSTVAVHDDPAFARRHIGERLVFVSAFDPDDKVEIYIVDANGACIAFPVPKREQQGEIIVGYGDPGQLVPTTRSAKPSPLQSFRSRRRADRSLFRRMPTPVPIVHRTGDRNLAADCFRGLASA